MGDYPNFGSACAPKSSVFFALLVALALPFVASASWNGEPYAPGQTLNPECAPTDENCTIDTGLSAWSTTDGGLFYDGGSVAIGTSTPQATFEVAGSGSGTFADGSAAQVFFDAPSEAPWQMVFRNDTARAAGAPDIGTYIDDTTGAMHLSAIDQADFLTLQPSIGGYYGTTTATGDFLTLANDSSALLYSSGATGNVGIGTTNPTEKLQVDGYIYSSVDSGDPGFWFNKGDAYTDDPIWGAINTGQYDRNRFSIGNNASVGFSGFNELFTILNNGNVGINNTNPQATLDVAGSELIEGDDSGGYLNFGGDGTGDSGYGIRDNGGTMQYKNSSGDWTDMGSGGTSQWSTDDGGISYTDGSVGIGTDNPNYLEQLVSTGDSGAYLGISNEGSDDGDRQLRIGFGNGQTYASIQGTRQNVADDVNLVLQPGGGDVGIGTTNPGYSLDVSGDINFSGSLFHDGMPVSLGSNSYLSGADYSGVSVDTSDQTTIPFGIAFSEDGTKMYVGEGYDLGTEIYEYTLSTAWDVSSAVYDTSDDVGGQPAGFALSNDGTTLYLSDGATNILEYTLGTPWDISTATNDDVSLDLSGQVSGEGNVDVALSSDGTTLYVSDFLNQIIYEYTLGTPWDLSSATYSGNEDDLSGSVSGEIGNVQFLPDGSKMFVSSYTGGSDTLTLYQYTLSTPWDITSATSDGISLNASALIPGFASGLFAVGDDGSKMYVPGSGGDGVGDIYEFLMGETSGSSLWQSSGNTAYLTNGEVAIGTSTPSAALTVWGPGTGDEALAEFVNNASTSVLQINDNGDIGIGTTTPSATLDVESASGGNLLALSVLSGTNGVASAGDTVTANYTPGFGTPSNITDGTFAPDGTSWDDSDYAVQLNVSGSDNNLSFDLGSVQAINRVIVQADGNDDYRVEYSTDDVSWNTLYDVPMIDSYGLQTRDSGVMEPVSARYIRVYAVDGDDSYAVSQVQVYSTTVMNEAFTVSSAGDLSMGGEYLNFGASTGDSGYGLRDASGTLQYKDNGGDWTSLASTTSDWVGSETGISYSAGDVSIGTSTPSAALTVWGPGTGDETLAQFVNSASSSVLTIEDNGSVGVGTDSVAFGATLQVAGDVLVSGEDGGYRYLNFGNTEGSDGYGIRSNEGALQFKDLGGDWTDFGASASSTPPSLTYATLVNSFDDSDVLTDGSYNVSFGDGGMKMYVGTESTYYEYSLSTPWDVSTASYDDKSFVPDIADEEVWSLAFSADGTELYVTDNDANVHEFPVDTPWDLSTVGSEASSLDVSGQIDTGGGTDSAFNADGTAIYVADWNTGNIYEYTLTNPWDLSSATYADTSLDVSAHVPSGSNLEAIKFTDGGTQLYIGVYSNDHAYSIYQYTLGTPWDITTAGDDDVSYSIPSSVDAEGYFTFADDGTTFYATVAHGESEQESVNEYEFGAPPAWTSSGRNVSYVGGDVGIGTTSPAYTLDVAGDINFSGSIYQNGEPLAFLQQVSGDTSLADATSTGLSADVSGETDNPFGLAFGDDGTKMYVDDAFYGDGDVYEYTLSRPYDPSSATYDTSFSSGGPATDIVLSADGSRAYISFGGDADLYQFDLGTLWDISSAQYNGVWLDESSQVDGSLGATFSADGTKLYVPDYDSGTVYEYTLDTPWDISTASYSGDSLDAGDAIDANPLDLHFTADGTRMYMLGGIMDSIGLFQFTLGTPWDISTATYDSIALPLPYATAPQFALSADGSRFYDEESSSIVEYSLGALSSSIDGSLLLSGADSYLNFDDSPGADGYGIRDNDGTLQFKNSGGDWTDFGESVWIDDGSGNISYDAGDVTLGDGEFEYASSTGQTSIDNLSIGAMSFPADAGIVSWMDLPVTDASSAGTIESYTASIGGEPVFTVYGEADGSGGVQNLRVGIGTTTPGAALDVNGSVALEDVGDSGGITTLCLDSSGNIVTNIEGGCTSSTERIKHDIEGLTISGTSTLMQITPSSFIYDSDASSTVRWGFIAEDLASTSVTFIDQFDSSGQPLTINPVAILAVAVKAIQELTVEVEGFATSFTSKQVQTDELCIGDTCVTETQLKALLQAANVQAAAPSANDSSGTSDTSASPESTSSTAVIVDQASDDTDATSSDDGADASSTPDTDTSNATSTDSVSDASSSDASTTPPDLPVSSDPSSDPASSTDASSGT